ncbi:MAG: flagellar basal body L-ring protein FlgH [Stagnimonas sp.]|nr:flagellar basal body L-ring protein FlgH [Stagnimonas sp.]
MKSPLVFFGINAGGCLLLVLMALFLVGCAAGPIPQGEMPPPRTVLAPPAEAERSQGSLYASRQGMSLFEDPKARGVGDLLTVLLVESTQASKSATTSTSKEAGVELGDIRAFGQPLNFDSAISGKNTFGGAGASAQSNKLSGSLTVTVVERLPNGVLRVRGDKRLRLNQGEEVMQLEGLVRGSDISPNNTIGSDRIAEARISYQGKGALADANAQGWLQRFFNSPWMPF